MTGNDGAWSIRNAITVTIGVCNIVEGQYAIRWVIAPLIDVVDWNTSTDFATVLEDGIGERANLLEGERAALREETDTAFADIAIEPNEAGSD
jgi:hypothetical protein